MNRTTSEEILDVRQMPPRDRHPAIMKTWHQLAAGGALMLVNDHDPLPLYYQFSCEHGGTFRWEYVEQGPEQWRVRLSKGDFADPGYVPPQKAPVSKAASCTATSVTLDVRPIFAAGDTPCSAIDDAVAGVKPGQTFVLLAPFEPAPLYSKLGHQGFSHKTTQMQDGSYRIEFSRPA